jgi:hypothetical protein
MVRSGSAPHLDGSVCFGMGWGRHVILCAIAAPPHPEAHRPIQMRGGSRPDHRRRRQTLSGNLQAHQFSQSRLDQTGLSGCSFVPQEPHHLVGAALVPQPVSDIAKNDRGWRCNGRARRRQVARLPNPTNLVLELVVLIVITVTACFESRQIDHQRQSYFLVPSDSFQRPLRLPQNGVLGVNIG